jgi:STE24 endopeptidase
LGWPALVRAAVGDLLALDEWIATLPPMLLVVGGWWWFHPIERRLRDATIARTLHTPESPPLRAFPSRPAYVWFWLRQSLLPILVPIAIISLWSDAAERLLSPHAPQGWVLAAQAAGVLLVLVMGPLLLRRVWNTHRLPESSIRALLAAVADRSRVRVREFLLWRTGGTIHNAAVLGFFAPARYILVTDAIIESMPAPLLEAVAAHEVGHVRRRHLLWLGLSTLAAILLAGLATGWLAWVSLLWAADRFALTEETGPPVRAALEALSVLMTLAAGLLWFGWVSRRFERQADAYAAQDLSRAAASGSITPEAADRVSEALGLVAGLNGIAPTRFMWRHGSIRARQRHVLRLSGRPIDALPIDATVRRLKVLTTLALAVAVSFLVYDSLSSP